MPQEILVKSLLNKKKQRDSWFLDEYTINPYSGCSFNCIYCYIRGSKYGIHMEEKLSIKANAIDVLEKQLRSRAKKGQFGIIVISSATDPYLQFEKELQLTRRILELVHQYKFPVHILTKSDLVIRDFDLLKSIEEQAILPIDLQEKLSRKVFITFSFSTTDDSIGKIFEPGATPPSLRLQTLRKTIENGFFSGVSLMPLIPYVTDTSDSLESMFRAFKDAGVHYIFPASLTLFGNGPADSKTLVFRAIEKHYPHLLEKYRKFFSYGYQMPTYYYSALEKKTNELCEKYGLKNRILTE